MDSIGFILGSIGFLLDPIGIYWILLDCYWIPIGIYWILLDPIATVCALPSPARVRVEAHFSGPAPRAWTAHEPRMKIKVFLVRMGAYPELEFFSFIFDFVGSLLDSIGFLLDCYWIPIVISWITMDSIGFLLVPIWFLFNSIGFLLDCYWILIVIYWTLLDPIAKVCALPSPARVRVEAHFTGAAPRAWTAHEPRMKIKAILVRMGT